MEVFRNHHFSAQALARLMTDNRDWAFGFEDYFKRIAVPTKILVADNKVGGAIMREEMSYLQRIAPPQVKFEFWEGVGHGMKAAKPEEYNQTLDAWLNPM
jgi:pimeloyl-ACP methyl ester carboxylesterase